jgi:hypothetical protein
MGFYRVKKLKGLLYLYEEHRYRKGGKVCCRSTYVGAFSGHAGGGAGALSGAQQREKIKELQDEIKKRMSPITFKAEVVEDTVKRRYQVSSILKNALKDHDTVDKIVKFDAPKPSIPSKKSKSAPAKPVLKQFVSKFNLKENKISELALKREQDALFSNLSRAGIDASKFPKITLKKDGYTGGYQKNFVFSGYTVFLPVGKPRGQNKFRRSYRKALAKASLELLEKENQKQFKQFKKSFLNSYSITQKKLRNYIQSSGDKNRDAKTSMVSGAFSSGHLPKLFKSKLKFSNLGLFDDEPRADWKDDFAATFAEVIRKGSSQAYKNRQIEYFRARREVENAEGAQAKHKGLLSLFSVGRLKAENRHMKATARLALQQEALNKIELIKQQFKV